MTRFGRNGDSHRFGAAEARRSISLSGLLALPRKIRARWVLTERNADPRWPISPGTASSLLAAMGDSRTAN